MGRIRTIKPEFFRHEGLQELAQKHDCMVMLVFIGLWTQSDKNGNFPWKPSILKLDILPFLEYDLSSTLEALRNSGFVIAYTGEDGKSYGHIPNFAAHQRFFGSEIKSPAKFPAFSIEKQNLEAPRKHSGSSLEATRTVEIGVLENGVMDNEYPSDTQRKDIPPKVRKHSFEKSPYYPFEKFRESLPEWPEQKCRDFFKRAEGYSKANGAKYLDWRQAVQNWERNDAQKAAINGHNNPQPQHKKSKAYV